MANLRESGVVHVASSEENPVEIDCGGRGFSVAFDPLDGSSIVDANFAVGTIT
jgi:sedoheptulose-bisphosphatase